MSLPRSVKTSGVAVAFALMGASMAAADCGKVSITNMNWASSEVVTAVSKFLMEQGYGCQVTAVPSSTNPALASVAETGEPDILTEIWINSSPAYPPLRDEGKLIEVTHVLSDGGEEGWWIPTYLAEEHPELKTLDGILANPDLVGGMFNNGPDGWGARITNENIAQAADLEGHGIKMFAHGSGETLAASIGAAYADKKPWFGYYWAPTSVLGKYPMAKVEIGPFDAAVHLCNTTPECATPGLSNYPTGKVVTAITPAFQEREPAIAELMSKVSFTNEQMGTLLAWREENNASSDETAVYFLTNYKDVWKDWLDDAAREKLAPLLQ